MRCSISTELNREEYAAYRSVTDKAERADIEVLIRDAREAKDDVIREHYRVLLNLVAEKNPQYIDIWKGEVAVRDVLMEIVKDRVEERIQETKAIDIRNLMANLKLTLSQAMDALGIPQVQRPTYAALVQQGV